MDMLKRFANIAALAMLLSVTPAAHADAPMPIRDGYVTETFEGWEKVELGDGDGNIKYMHRPRGGPHMGSAAWFFGMNGSDKKAAFIAAAKAGGITNVKILATHRMNRARLLDSRGSGAAFIAEGTRAGKGPYKMAGLVIHGSFDKNEVPGLGVNMFVSPQDKYAGMGGWVVPASLWLNLDPYKEVSDTNAQGNASAAIQAQRLAGIADIWAEWVLNEYILMAQNNITALSNARQSVVCAGDPTCVLVPVP